MMEEQTEEIAHKMAKARVCKELRIADIIQECRARGIDVTQDEKRMRNQLTQAIAREYMLAGAADFDVLSMVFHSRNPSVPLNGGAR